MDSLITLLSSDGNCIHADLMRERMQESLVKCSPGFHSSADLTDRNPVLRTTDCNVLTQTLVSSTTTKSAKLNSSFCRCV